MLGTSDRPGMFTNGPRQRKPGSIVGSGESSCRRGGLPIQGLTIHAPAVAAIVIDAPADVNAANNDDIVFYLRDLSSSLVNSKKNATAAPSYKAVPVCCLSSSVSVDVLGLMHERTGHFHKRGLIECVKSRIVDGLKIENKDIRKFRESDNKCVISVHGPKQAESHFKRSTQSEAKS